MATKKSTTQKQTRKPKRIESDWFTQAMGDANAAVVRNHEGKTKRTRSK